MSRPASRWRAKSIRFPTKPWHTPTSTGTFPRRRARAIAVAMVSLELSSPRTTSTSRMMLAGLKKWVPMTLSGRPVTAAMALTSRALVLVASTAWPGAIASSLRKVSCLTPISSNTASTTTSASRAASRSRLPRMSPRRFSTCSGVSPPPRRGVLVVPADGGEPAFEGFPVHLHHRHRDAGVGEAHGDAAAHRSAAHDDRPLDVDGPGAAGDVRDLRGLRARRRRSTAGRGPASRP